MILTENQISKQFLKILIVYRPLNINQYISIFFSDIYIVYSQHFL